MFEFLKNILKPKKTVESYFPIDEKKLLGEKNTCNKCGNSSFCKVNGTDEKCMWIQPQKEFDKNKPTILIIDDHPGMISFLEDDMECMAKYDIIDLDSYNFITFTGQNAVYHFLATDNYYNGLNVEVAIIDLTFGGSVITETGSVRYTGIEVFERIYSYNKDVKYLFYTGNSLNSYIKSNNEMIVKFNNITGDDILKHILFKSSKSLIDRRKYFAKVLFNVEESKFPMDC